MESCSVALPNVEGNVLRIKTFDHIMLCSSHQTSGQTQLSVGTKDSKRRDVAMTSLCVLFHFGEHIANYLALARRVLSYIKQLWPRENMIEVVLHLVIFGEAC